LKDPAILLLDEATSALDSQTEASIQDSLRDMGQGRTVITIAHRLSTIADSDRIVVLEDGFVIEEGRHDALIANGGRYAAMWARQTQDDDDPTGDDPSRDGKGMDAVDAVNARFAPASLL